MRKYIRLIGMITSIVCLSFFVLCSLDSEKSNNKEENSCTIRFSWWGGDDRHDVTLKAIELFESKYPHIDIQAEYGGWDGWTEKITTQIAGGTEPDIMQINYDWLVRFSKDGKGFANLEELSNQLGLDNFDNEVLDYGRQNGVLNAVPISMTGRSLFFNKNTFEETGAEIPENWDDLMNLGEVFRESGNYPLDLDIQSGFTAWYLAVVYTQQKFGKEFITYDGKLNFTVEEIEETLNFYKTLEENGVVRTVKQRINDDGNDALYQSSEFIDGSVAGVLEWGSAVGKYDMSLEEDILVTGNLLFIENCEISGWFVKPSVMYAMSNNTKNPEECALFLDFILNDKECAEILGTSRGIPSSRSAYESLEEKDMLKGLAYESYVQINECNPVSISPYMELSEMSQCYNEAIENISYNKMSVEDTAEQMYVKIQKVLEKFKD